MTEHSWCAKCSNHCCRSPLITTFEACNIKKKYGIELKLVPNDTTHLTNIYEHRISGPICQLFGLHGCILDYSDRPSICKIYPWIPYSFIPGEYELLLDVDRCGSLSKNWTTTYIDAKKEFDQILKNNTDWK